MVPYLGHHALAHRPLALVDGQGLAVELQEDRVTGAEEGRVDGLCAGQYLASSPNNEQ